MTKLNDNQMVILSKALNNGDIVPASIIFGANNALKRNIKALISKGFLETRNGLKGSASLDDYAFIDENNQARRLFATSLAHDLYEGNDEETTEEDDFELADIQDFDIEETTEGEDDEEEARPNSVVRENYKKAYAMKKAEGGSGQGCNDGLDKWMTSTFMVKIGGKGRPALDVVALMAFANENGIDTIKWVHVNNGMKRMNIAKRVRILIEQGNDITYGKKVVFKGKKQNVKKAA